MANGGFGYAECSILYDSMGYFAKRSWAKAVHIARCKAFVWATYRGWILNPDGDYQGVWASDVTDDDIIETIPRNPDITDPSDPNYDSYDLYIQDLHPSDIDPNGQYPAFYTVFENPRTFARYAIITSLGFTNNSSQANDPSKGLFIPNDLLAGNGTYKFVPFDLAHMFGCNNISSSNHISTGSLASGELPVSTPYGVNFSDTTSTTSTASNNNAIIQNPTQGVTYTFGYGVKELMIECFYKNSLFASNTGMLWSLIGNIFEGNLVYDTDTDKFTTFPFGYINLYRNGQNEKNGLSASDYSYYIDHNKIDCDCLCDDDGWSYRHKIVGQSVLSKASLLPSFLPYRSSSSSPQKLKWSAGCLGFAFDAGYNTTRNFAGIDGLGNNSKGYLKNELFRFVSIFATRIGGSTYQGSNFVSMYMGTPQNNLEFGVLLGWDPSNPSII